ncbi:MAG TPA: DoxX family protein [Terriglobia bacterium]|nr:DoxX family protein [Terriglobia bacterium]
METGTSGSGWGLTILRIVVGVVFAMHGGQKFSMGFRGVAGFFGGAGIPFPMASAVVVTLLEFFGGLALIAGLFTRWVSLLIAFEMFVAILKIHLRGGFFLPAGFEYALTMFAANLALVLSGAGRASLDGLRSQGAAGKR